MSDRLGWWRRQNGELNGPTFWLTWETCNTTMSTTHNDFKDFYFFGYFYHWGCCSWRLLVWTWTIWLMTTNEPQPMFTINLLFIFPDNSVTMETDQLVNNALSGFTFYCFAHVVILVLLYSYKVRKSILCSISLDCSVHTCKIAM